MRNVDYWKDELLKINGEIGIVDNKPRPCHGLFCGNCDRHGKCNEYDLIKWLYEEHIEKQTLTKKQHMLCEILESGYIARDKYGDIYYHNCKPNKIGNEWNVEGELNRDYDFFELKSFKTLEPFNFIKWEDKEPWSIKDLLALEVKDDPVTT